MLTTAYATAAQGTTFEDIVTALDDAYLGEPFVSLIEQSPETRWVVGSNRAFISAYLDERSRTVVLISAIDNLIKGAAGQAVQNANIMLGVDEAAGLPREGWMP
jgi:N-acetyl-gamma-glutamyl-phosphate reductase